MTSDIGFSQILSGHYLRHTICLIFILAAQAGLLAPKDLKFQCNTVIFNFLVMHLPFQHHYWPFPCSHSVQECLHLEFASPVCWTDEKTEIELNLTAKDRTTSCSCTNSEFFPLPVARFVEKSKNRKNRSFVLSCVGIYSRTFFPNCLSFDHKKRSRIGWDCNHGMITTVPILYHI